MQLLNAGCGTHYAKGWVNVDVWEDPTTKPDIRVEPGEPYPFPDGHFDAVYLGHVIEHIDWAEVPVFIDDMIRVAKPGAPILVVGPDVFRTIHRWAAGKEPWEMVLSTMEHQDINYQPGAEFAWWDGATHHWNCHLQRVWDLLTHRGLTNIQDFTDVIPNDTAAKTWMDPQTRIAWPVVSKWHWQFAIMAYTQNP